MTPPIEDLLLTRSVCPRRVRRMRPCRDLYPVWVTR